MVPILAFHFTEDKISLRIVKYFMHCYVVKPQLKVNSGFFFIMQQYMHLIKAFLHFSLIFHNFILTQNLNQLVNEILLGSHNHTSRALVPGILQA